MCNNNNHSTSYKILLNSPTEYTVNKSNFSSQVQQKKKLLGLKILTVKKCKFSSWKKNSLI